MRDTEDYFLKLYSDPKVNWKAQFPSFGLFIYALGCCPFRPTTLFTGRSNAEKLNTGGANVEQL